jgi:hypothetical protein
MEQDVDASLANAGQNAASARVPCVRDRSIDRPAPDLGIGQAV